MIDYEFLKTEAKERGVKVADLIALSHQNDPFYVGTPNDLAVGEWFADLWNRFGYSTGVHLRRVHYQIVSQRIPVEMPSGGVYENTEKCWDFLGQASKMARYLTLVDPAAFVDRRNHAPIINASNDEIAPSIEISSSGYSQDSDLPEFPSLPNYDVYSFYGKQNYLLEIWCEKTTMDDELIPICQEYGVNLVRGVGEMSITATLELTNRIAADGRPARIFYISDFDPAGKSMPVAVSRKTEYFIRLNESDADIRLFPIVLTEQQVRLYRLPRTPIKETEARRAGFEAQFGTGAVELDALEALRAGELARIVRRHLDQYYDKSLNRRTYQAASELRDELKQITAEIENYFSTEITELREEYDALKAEFAERLAAHNEKRADLFEQIETELETRKPNIEDYPIPEAENGDEIGEGLYNSQRDYFDQIDAYKEFQGKNNGN